MAYVLASEARLSLTELRYRAAVDAVRDRPDLAGIDARLLDALLAAAGDRPIRAAYCDACRCSTSGTTSKPKASCSLTRTISRRIDGKAMRVGRTIAT
jgi:hypothetical protein